MHQYYSFKNGIPEIKIFKSNALYGAVISMLIGIQNYL